MNTEFCMNCGSKVEFALKAPNFCPSCGSPFNEVSKASSTAVSEVSETQSDPDDISTQVPQLSKLQYSIGDSSQKVTFGDLANQAQASSGPYEKAPPRPAPKSRNGEDVIKSVMAECASAREPKELSDT